ncbi:hypothetical protein BJ742DRAFT_827243 [Cladochytrium replicatum]|nr:hypothetical protein BJ742DRAFT_827243 [Cladochytrium replicatum]
MLGILIAFTSHQIIAVVSQEFIHFKRLRELGWPRMRDFSHNVRVSDFDLGREFCRPRCPRTAHNGMVTEQSLCLQSCLDQRSMCLHGIYNLHCRVDSPESGTATVQF